MKKQIFLVLLLMLVVSACGAQTQPVTGSFAGRVEGSDAFIGLVRNGDQMMTYYCDGTAETTPVLWGWFRGELNGSAFDLTNENGDHLIGEFNADGASGTITLAGGSALNFLAEPVSQPAGLYRHQETVEGAEAVAGWIVLANGEVRGGKQGGSQLISATNKPTGWVDPDVEPVRWVEPDVEP